MSRFFPALATLLLALGVVVMAQAVPARPPAVVQIATVGPSPTAVPSETAPSARPSAASPSPTALPAIPDGYHISIPRLAIDLDIREGDVERDTVLQKTPENYAFHLPGTAIPGAGANSYIYAHARVGMFLSLWNVRPGDVVLIGTPDGRSLTYVVSEVHPRVPPNDVSWTEPTPPDRLTLQTSTGPNPGDPRFVVVALPG
jgi:sortase (surface protein transpeptidase)